MLFCRLEEAKKYLMVEVEIKDAIIKKCLDDNSEKTNQLRHFAFLLKVPRLHHAYLTKHGIDDFVRTVMRIVKEN